MSLLTPLRRTVCEACLRLLRRVILCVRCGVGFSPRWHLLYPSGEFFRFSVCVSLTCRWTSSVMAIAAVETHESIQEESITRGYVSASLSAFWHHFIGREQLIQDILLNTEASGNAHWVTAANANISPHAANRLGTNAHQQWSMDLYGATLSRRDSRWRTQNELRSAFRANYLGELLDPNSTPGQRL